MPYPNLSDRPHREHLKYLLWPPVYLAGYLILERRFTTDFYFTNLPIDERIPFCEVFVIFYCSWYFLLIGTALFLMLRDTPAFHRYMTFLGWTCLLSTLIWFLFPSAQALRPDVMPRENLFTAVISLLYQVDTCTNVFPSVHVVGSVGVALALCDYAYPRHKTRLRISIVLLAGLICASTVLIKQHALIDVAGGLALSLAVAFPIYYQSPAFHFHRKPA